jgi:probable phosphoglycerate mutase
MGTLVLLRHGETVHTARKLFSGSGGEDPPLTPTGQAQAAAAAASLTDRGVTAVVSSPMRRARETADAAAAVLGLPVREVDDVRECAFGEWEGQSFAEVRERWPDELSAWWGQPLSPPGGESSTRWTGGARRARCLGALPRGRCWSSATSRRSRRLSACARSAGNRALSMVLPGRVAD